MLCEFSCVSAASKIKFLTSRGEKYESSKGTTKKIYTFLGQKRCGEIVYFYSVIEKAYDGGFHVLKKNKQKHKNML